MNIFILRFVARLMVLVGEVENSLFECSDLSFYLMSLNVRFELSQVVDGALAMSRCDDICWVQPKVSGDFTPCCFDSGNRISERAIL